MVIVSCMSAWYACEQLLARTGEECVQAVHGGRQFRLVGYVQVVVAGGNPYCVGQWTTCTAHTAVGFHGYPLKGITCHALLACVY